MVRTSTPEDQAAVEFEESLENLLDRIGLMAAENTSLVAQVDGAIGSDDWATGRATGAMRRMETRRWIWAMMTL